MDHTAFMVQLGIEHRTGCTIGGPESREGHVGVKEEFRREEGFRGRKRGWEGCVRVIHRSIREWGPEEERER